MPNTMPLVRRVRATSAPNTLAIDWKGGGSDTVDLTGLIARIKAFAPLKEADAFAAVRADDTAMGIEWDCGLDLSGTTLKTIAEEQRPMAAAEFVRFMTDYGISIREAGDLFGFSVSTIKTWRAGRGVAQFVERGRKAVEIVNRVGRRRGATPRRPASSSSTSSANSFARR